jgi:hypothetical protein
LPTAEVFFLGDSTAPTGAPLTPGQLAAAETPFNFGIVAAGQKSNRILTLNHSAGTQGVLIGNIQVTGDPSVKLISSPVFPILVRPGGSIKLELEYSSITAAGVDASLEITAAIPKGLVLKIPLEANRTALPIMHYNPKTNSGKAQSVTFWKQG